MISEFLHEAGARAVLRPGGDFTRGWVPRVSRRPGYDTRGLLPHFIDRLIERDLLE
jgi:hypothetical protein